MVGRLYIKSNVSKTLSDDYGIQCTILQTSFYQNIQVYSAIIYKRRFWKYMDLLLSHEDHWGIPTFGISALIDSSSFKSLRIQFSVPTYSTNCFIARFDQYFRIIRLDPKLLHRSPISHNPKGKHQRISILPFNSKLRLQVHSAEKRFNSSQNRPHSSSLSSSETQVSLRPHCRSYGEENLPVP